MTPQLEAILSEASLKEAWTRVSHQTRTAGSDGVTVAAFGTNLAEHFRTIREDVLAQTYTPLPLIRFRIPKAGGGERALHTAAVRDRVLQSSVLHRIDPLIDATLCDGCHSYRRGRSWRTALEAARDLVARGYSWVCRADIHAFFDSIAHAKLQACLALTELEDSVRSLLMQWSRGPIIDQDQTLRPHCGVAQGLLVGPLLSNLYLRPVDQQLQQRDAPFIRYGDDLILLAKCRQDAEALLVSLTGLLAERELQLSEAKTRVTPASQVRYLGHALMEAPVERPRPEAQPPAAVAGASRTLYLCRPGCVLRRQGRRFAVFSGDEALVHVSPRRLRQIVALGSTCLTLPAIRSAVKCRIPIYLLTASGEYWGRIDHPAGGNLDLERRQWAMTPPAALEIARQMVAGKLFNSIALLRESGAGRQAFSRLRALAHRSLRAASHGELLGLEGAAASAYFKELSRLLPEEFQFSKRTHHPPADPANSLLSFAYTLLHHNLATAIEIERLNPRVGILHQQRADFASLASDLMEEFRAPVADRFVIRFVREGGVHVSDFRAVANGFYMESPVRRQFVQRFESLLWENVPGAPRTWREQFQYQAHVLAEVLNERRKQYNAFRWNPAPGEVIRCL